MSTYGCVMVGRNDNYGGNLAERALYAINSCIESYDEVIYVDWNSRDEPLHKVIRGGLLDTGKLRCITVTPEEHKEFTKEHIGAQHCSETLGRNVGLRRLSTDFLVSTNIDEINPPRNFLESFTSKDTFVTVARLGISLSDAKNLGTAKEVEQVREGLSKRKFSQSWAVTREPYSLVEWCGDLQMAHRTIWHEIKGYEESQLGVGVHDSFIQRKAKELGYAISADYNIPLWHLDHHKQSDYTNEETCVAEPNSCLYEEFIGSNNKDTWGFSDYNFKEEII